ncbi:hypothetical protein EIP91_002007 [Steccherinum ochraceum]|uniref:Uncharacterized protein n=1 Tax=Steccherinum ochraceum TaxID=92696 RepID=A0A4R0RLE6_9APHY|nr:hypothetical protein EIP91_002007 [Steccherinum ochraceum]
MHAPTTPDSFDEDALFAAVLKGEVALPDCLKNLTGDEVYSWMVFAIASPLLDSKIARGDLKGFREWIKEEQQTGKLVVPEFDWDQDNTASYPPSPLARKTTIPQNILRHGTFKSISDKEDQQCICRGLDAFSTVVINNTPASSHQVLATAITVTGPVDHPQTQIIVSMGANGKETNKQKQICGRYADRAWTAMHDMHSNAGQAVRVPKPEAESFLKSSFAIEAINHSQRKVGSRFRKELYQTTLRLLRGNAKTLMDSKTMKKTDHSLIAKFLRLHDAVLAATKHWEGDCKDSHSPPVEIADSLSALAAAVKAFKRKERELFVRLVCLRAHEERAKDLERCVEKLNLFGSNMEALRCFIYEGTSSESPHILKCVKSSFDWIKIEVPEAATFYANPSFTESVDSCKATLNTILQLIPPLQGQTVLPRSEIEARVDKAAFLIHAWSLYGKHKASSHGKNHKTKYASHCECAIAHHLATDPNTFSYIGFISMTAQGAIAEGQPAGPQQPYYTLGSHTKCYWNWLLVPGTPVLVAEAFKLLLFRDLATSLRSPSTWDYASDTSANLALDSD